MNNFSFSNPAAETGNKSREEMEYDKWAERIKGQYSYFSKPADDAAKPGAWARPRSPKKAQDLDGDGSGTPSPELWKTPESPSAAVRSAYGRLSHVSHGARAQTIAKYRQEMLDLVRGMPEAAYELSLRDIVESPKIASPLPIETETEAEAESEKKKKGRNSKGGMVRSESMESGGLMLKMLIPKVLKGRKSTGGSAGTGAKVSPNATLGGGEREWWSEEFGEMTSSSGSSSSNNSSNSSGGGEKRRNGKLRGCYPFFQTR